LGIQAIVNFAGLSTGFSSTVVAGAGTSVVTVGGVSVLLQAAREKIKTKAKSRYKTFFISSSFRHYLIKMNLNLRERFFHSRCFSPHLLSENKHISAVYECQFLILRFSAPIKIELAPF
jgi:hypothetical protein